MKIPVIENIHQRVLEAVTAEESSLDMSQWHTCDTTHCRAGWVVTLAGEEGRELERQTDTGFAAVLRRGRSKTKRWINNTTGGRHES